MDLMKPQLGRLLRNSHNMAQGLVGCWPFFEGGGNTVADLSGNGNRGILGSGVTWDGGKFGPSLNCNESAFVTVANSTLFDDKRTISYWMRPTGGWSSGEDSDERILTHRTAAAPAPGVTFVLLQATGALRIANDIGAANINTTSTITSWSDDWYHIVGVADGSNIHLYINGIDNAQTAHTGAFTTAVNSLYFGCSRSGATIFDGLIDNVLIYNRALTAGEIAKLYREPFCMFEVDL